VKRPYRGRFAPSPTGDLHIGGASTALCAWLAARAAGGTLVMRIEDIDTPRIVPGSEQRILEDLKWLGLDWDEGPSAHTNQNAFGPYRQSERTSFYERAIATLESRGLTYPCDCSRKELAALASAPTPGDDGPIYPGICRSAPQLRKFRRPPATRIRVPHNTHIVFHDAVFGEQQVNLADQTGDFVLQRGDGIFSYQLAVVVDDLAQDITEIVRGADLLSSTARQLFLIECLGGQAPTYCHAPVIVGPRFEKLAKRDRRVPVRDHREAGVDPKRLIARLAQALGLAESGEDMLAPQDLIARFSWERVSKGPIVVNTILA